MMRCEIRVNYSDINCIKHEMSTWVDGLRFRGLRGAQKVRPSSAMIRLIRFIRLSVDATYVRTSAKDLCMHLQQHAVR